MALIQHYNEKIRFQQQLDNAKAYVIPFIEEVFTLKTDMLVLDIGCGDGGVMLPFLEMGIKTTGIELNQQKADFAKQFLSNFLETGQAEIINLNIYEAEALEKYKAQFDLIILKDVIEHIFDQDKFIPYLKQFLKPGGRVYFGFPPWYMPHGGHQQVCSHKLLSALPYVHLLPVPLYRLLLKAFGETEPTIKELLEIKSTGISIERFEKLVLNNNYTIEAKKHYLINPIYKFKFGWKPKEQYNLVQKIPFFRNFITTCVYYLIRK